MNFPIPHTVSFFFFCATIGLIGCTLFVGFLCQFLAYGKREDAERIEFRLRSEQFQIAQSGPASDRQSDCPSLSAIIRRFAGRGLLEPGMSLYISNSPYRPLALELVEPVTTDGPPVLLAYHFRRAKVDFVRECEMAFELTEGNGEFSLKAIRYLPAKPEYIATFARMWSDDLEKRGYVDAALSVLGHLEKQEVRPGDHARAYVSQLSLA
jgi:hypothetical protein